MILVLTLERHITIREISLLDEPSLRKVRFVMSAYSSNHSLVNAHSKGGGSQNQGKSRKGVKGSAASILVPVPGKAKSMLGEVEPAMTPSRVAPPEVIPSNGTGTANTEDSYTLNQNPGSSSSAPEKESLFSPLFTRRSSRRSSISSVNRMCSFPSSTSEMPASEMVEQPGSAKSGASDPAFDTLSVCRGCFA